MSDYEELITTIKDGEFVYNLYAVEEDISPYDVYDTSNEGLKEECDEIARKVDLGYLEAWFCLKVVCKHPKIVLLEGTSYLGSCSYESFENFLETEKEGYIPDQLSQAKDDLMEKLQAMYKEAADYFRNTTDKCFDIEIEETKDEITNPVL